MDHFQSSYLKRNMSLKIMVLDLKWHDLQNWDHHWPASCLRTSENNKNQSNSHCIARSRSRKFGDIPLK
jgi:hypothetical protein